MEKFSSTTMGNTEASVIQVLLVEDDEVFRAGLTVALKQTDKLDLVGVCADGQTAIKMAGEHQPQVILMDLGLPILNGIEAIKIIKANYPVIKILALTSSSERKNVEKCMQAGADGFCLKGISLERLIILIQEVQAGIFWIDAAVAEQIKHRFQQGLSRHDEETIMPLPKEILQTLTEREGQVLARLAEGKNNMDIAKQLGISLGTVRVHVHSILTKLNVKNRTQAALFLKRIPESVTEK